MAAAYNLQATGTLTPIDRHVINDGKKANKKPEPSASAAGPAVVPTKKTSTSEDAEAAAVARQNQLNEQQAQGNKSPVANGDPHNETTISEISADITIDSVKDHTMAQQQLLDSTMTSTTSKSSIKPPPVIVEEVVDDKAEESNPAAAPSEQITETNGVNGSTEDVNGIAESLESTVITDHISDQTTEIIPDLKNEIDGDLTLTVEDNHIEHDDTANNDQENDDVNETVIHEKTILETSMKPIKNEISTAVTDAKADEQSLDKSKEVLEEVQAPLACEESDPAPLASLESTNSSDLQSM